MVADLWDLLAGSTGFQWDDGNATKNWAGHEVSQGECEQVFFSSPFLVAPDLTHSIAEPRFYALGQTATAPRLFLVFTLRGTLIRVIAARDMSRRERKVYVDAQASEAEP